VLKLALAKLVELGSRDKRQDDISGEAFLKCGFDSKRVGGVDKNTSVLRSNDRIDNGGQIVYIGKSLYTKDDVIEGTILVSSSIFRVSND
jgi:hypothetical protein